jgi:hypothetical protein
VAVVGDSYEILMPAAPVFTRPEATCPKLPATQVPEVRMLDGLLVLLVIIFFALSWGFVRLCEKL